MNPGPTASGLIPRILVDIMLGRLARWLRLLGFDAPLLRHPPPRISNQEVLITRRRRLKGKPGVVLVEHDHWARQLAQVVRELDLAIELGALFTRCLDCNRLVETISRNEAKDMVPEFTLHTAARFTRCPACARVFWPGSHGERALEMIQGILAPFWDRTRYDLPQ